MVVVAPPREVWLLQPLPLPERARGVPEMEHLPHLAEVTEVFHFGDCGGMDHGRGCTIRISLWPG